MCFFSHRNCTLLSSEESVFRSSSLIENHSCRIVGVLRYDLRVVGYDLGSLNKKHTIRKVYYRTVSIGHLKLDELPEPPKNATIDGKTMTERFHPKTHCLPLLTEKKARPV